MKNNYNYSVFINCPFDDNYKNILYCIIFAVQDCGYIPRCSLEIDNASLIRISKISQIIKKSKLSINDLSRTELDKITGLPRFNMPFELGIFIGAKLFGSKMQKNKTCLILDRDKYRYRKYISDISGQDIRAHRNDIKTVILIVRDWIQNNRTDKYIAPGGEYIYRRYIAFMKDLPKICNAYHLNPRKLIFNDFVKIVVGWLNVNKFE